MSIKKKERKETEAFHCDGRKKVKVAPPEYSTWEEAGRGKAGWGGGGWRVPFLYSFSSLPPPVMITYKSCFENDSNESGVRARALSILPNFHWPF